MAEPQAAPLPGTFFAGVLHLLFMGNSIVFD